jgi:urease accessory protein UreE
MAEPVEPIFNNIIKQIIKKSLFTERQIQIILNQSEIQKRRFSITKGAYFRQVKQSRDKLLALYYSVILLKGLGVLLTGDVELMSRLSQQVSVIQSSDIFPEREEEIIVVIDELLRRACRM